MRMSILGSLLLCVLLFMNGDLLTLTLSLKKEASNMTSSCRESERHVLLDVKANVGVGKRDLYDWGSEGENYTDDCCNWMGVKCRPHTGHVIELHFYGLNFQLNPIPKVLGFLSKLEILNMYGANVSGPIPHELGNLSNLIDLTLSSNSLCGPIPHQLGNLSNLRYLDLGHNFFHGHIPHQLANNVFTLDLDNNHFQGTIPSSFGDLTLSHLILSQNHIGGVIPESFWNSSFFHLDLSQNLLTGPMPECSSLYFMSLANNYLNGSLPDFTNCKILTYLDLSGNQISGNVPNSLGQVVNLEVLDFSSNYLEGVITEIHLQNLTSLDYLDLSFNYLALQLNVHSDLLFQLSTIKLQSCNLGPGFPIWLKTQVRFKYLDISNASISDSMPTWFWDLPGELEFMNISSNGIKGPLPKPDRVSIFYGYAGIDLSNNHLEGSVQLMHSQLAALNLSGNRFSRTLSFLCEIDDGLSFLDLSNNSFSGRLPECWLKFHEKLVVIDLSNNNLSGEITRLGFLYNLEALNLRTNSFVGDVQVSLSNLTKLRFLDLGENMLSGVIPEWIGEKLSDLYILVLGSNKFHGRLPSQLCWLNKLQVLDVSNNALLGNIPRCFDNFTAMASGNFGDDMTSHSYYTYFSSYRGPHDHHGSVCYPSYCQKSQPQQTHFLDNALVTWKGKERSFERIGLQLLMSIDLSRNNLSGTLSYEITNLTYLASLNLSTNKLHGEVPTDMGRLKFLQSLDLSRNEFYGNIPMSLAQLNFLSVLDLSNNNLSGRIPTGTQLQGFNYTSYSGNPKLCGPPLTPRCGFAPADGKKDVKEDEDDSWKSYYIGMGVGFVTGLLGICGALVINRGCRYFFFALLCHMKDWIYVIVAIHLGKLTRKFRR